MQDWKKDFPLKDSYRRADGKTIEFEITADETPTGYRLIAEETEKSKGKRFGYRFSAFSRHLPYDALGYVRTKIRKNLSTKYLDVEDGTLSLTHDKLVGRIDYSEQDDRIVIESDGRKITSEEFWKILSSYEGFEIKIKIKEQ